MNCLLPTTLSVNCWRPCSYPPVTPTWGSPGTRDGTCPRCSAQIFLLTWPSSGPPALGTAHYSGAFSIPVFLPQTHRGFCVSNKFHIHSLLFTLMPRPHLAVPPHPTSSICCCSVAKSTLWTCSTPGLPVPHHLLDFTQVHVH